MKRQFSPAFFVAVLALVIAAGGTGFAAGKITSAQIKDNTIQSRDVRDKSLTGVDIKDNSIPGTDLRGRSVPRGKLKKSCAPNEEAAFGGCVRRAAFGPSSYQAAIDDCNRRNGRLPTGAELRWIAAHDEYGWADGNVGNYEFTGDVTDPFPVTPIAYDRGGNVVANSSAQLFWHHCVTY